jgi:hypothetical protein
MPEDFDGPAIARARIAEEAERRTGFLDLGRLGTDSRGAILTRHCRGLTRQSARTSLRRVDARIKSGHDE